VEGTLVSAADDVEDGDDAPNTKGGDVEEKTGEALGVGVDELAASLKRDADTKEDINVCETDCALCCACVSPKIKAEEEGTFAEVEESDANPIEEGTTGTADEDPASSAFSLSSFPYLSMRAASSSCLPGCSGNCDAMMVPRKKKTSS